MRFSVCLVIALLIPTPAAAQPLSVVPNPASVERGQGAFAMDVNTVIRVVGWDRPLARTARMWHPGEGEPSWIFADEIVIE